MSHQRQTPVALNLGKRTGTHCTEGWVGPGPIWTSAVNLAPHRVSNPEPSSSYLVAIPTTLPGRTRLSEVWISLPIHLSGILSKSDKKFRIHEQRSVYVNKAQTSIYSTLRNSTLLTESHQAVRHQILQK